MKILSMYVGDPKGVVHLVGELTPSGWKTECGKKIGTDISGRDWYFSRGPVHSLCEDCEVVAIRAGR